MTSDNISGMNSGEFGMTTYVDDEVRVSRGKDFSHNRLDKSSDSTGGVGA